MKQDTAEIGINLPSETSGCSNLAYQSENALPGAPNTPLSKQPFHQQASRVQIEILQLPRCGWEPYLQHVGGKAVTREEEKKGSTESKIVPKQLSHSLAVKVDPAQQPG